MMRLARLARLPAAFVTAALLVGAGPRAVLAEYRSDLEIHLGGKFVNHAKEGTWPPGLVVNYYTAVRGEAAGAQVVIYGKPANPREMHEQAVAIRSQQFETKSERTIDGASCWRFGYRNNPTYALWQCLYGDYDVSIAKQDDKTKVDEVAMLKTIFQRLGGEQPTASVRVDGNTIFVTDGSGIERAVTLVPPTKGAPPTFNPPTVGGEAKAFEKYVMTHMFEASYGHLPPELRSTFVSGMPMPSDVAGEAAQAVLDAGESAANWVKDNPADASLMVLSTAVSLAFPLSAFANPAVATGGAAVLRGVVGTAMVAGTSGFVQKLMSNVFTDQTATQRFKEAAAKGAGDAVATVPGSLIGAGFEKVAEQIIAKAAVTAGSVAVGIATDKATEKLQVSEKTAALVMKAPSYASSLLTLPGPSPEPGGMSLNFDR